MFHYFSLIAQPFDHYLPNLLSRENEFSFFLLQNFYNKKINLVQYKLESAQLIFFSDLCLPLTTAE